MLFKQKVFSVPGSTISMLKYFPISLTVLKISQTEVVSSSTLIPFITQNSVICKGIKMPF